MTSVQAPALPHVSLGQFRISWHNLYRPLLLVALVVVVFWHSLVLVAYQSASIGFRYLLVVPVWCLLVAWGQRHQAKRTLDIHDRQTDWLIAVIVALVSALVMHGMERRLDDVALLWRLDLFAMLCWLWVCVVVLYGLRAALGFYRVWGMAILCCPALHTLVSQRISHGSPAVTDGLLAAAAAYLAADGRRRRTVAGAATLVICLMVHAALPGRPAVFLVFAAVVPIVALAASNRFIDGRPAAGQDAHSSAGAHLGDRKRSAFRLLSLAALGVVVGSAVYMPPGFPTAAAGPMSITQPLLGAGWTVKYTDEYSWVSRYLGPSATLTRYTEVGGSDTTAVVDVVRNAQTATLGAGQFSYFYGGGVAAQLARVSLGAGIVARISSSNSLEEVSPADPTWLGIQWAVAHEGDSGLSDQVTIFLPQSATQNAVAAPPIARPSLSTVFLQPFSAMVRGNPVPARLTAVQREELIELAGQVLANQDVTGP